MTPEAKRDLEANARKATVGTWRAWITNRRQPEIYTDSGPENENDKIASGVLRKADAAFIAAANPAAVLDLLAENARLREALIYLAGEKNDGGEHAWNGRAWVPFRDIARAALNEQGRG